MKLKITLLSALFLAGAAAAPAAEDAHVVSNFDDRSPEPFSFKDEKGSILNASGAYTDAKKGRHLGVRFNVVEGGWAGWGLGMGGFDASGYKYLSFELKGKDGGEVFEVGLRDESGQEKKLPIRQFMDTPADWKQVLVPLTAFAGVDVSRLNNINLGFSHDGGPGLVFIDNIRFEGAAGAQSQTLSTSPTLVNKSLVDGFERTNPTEVYQVFQGDESTLSLTSSRVVFDGDYAMELEYQFSTTRPWGSWVSAARHFRDPLDWTGAQEIKMWVKGDGSENIVRFRVTEADGEAWEFLDDDILRFTRYTLMTIPAGRLRLVDPTKTDGKLDLGRLRAYQIDILSPTSKQASGAKTTAGRVQVDQLYISGERIRAAQSAPPGTVPKLRQAVASNGNVDFTLFTFNEYFFAPEKKSEVNHLAKLIASAKLSNYSARVEFASQSQEFGQAAAFIGSSVTSTDNRFPSLESPSFQVMVNNISPYLTNLTLGNIFVDYTPYTFAPVFGFKGAAAEGDYGRLNYHLFTIKHTLNSFSGGTRVRALWPRWKLSLYGVYYEQNARVNNPSSVTGGSLNQTANVVELKRAAQDLVYSAEAEGRFLRERVTLKGTYGYNSYYQGVQMDLSNPRDPVYAGPLAQPLTPSGKMWRWKGQAADLLWRGLTTSYEYRNVDTNFKPHFRQTPPFFDDTDSDQWGHNVRVTQFHKGWVFSNEYDHLKRRSSSRFYRHRYSWGVGYYGYKGLDVTFYQEYRRAFYIFTSDRSTFGGTTNEKTIVNELYIRSQLTPRAAFWVKPKQDHVWKPAENKPFVSDSLQMKLEFYISTNARFFAEHKVTKYGEPASEPLGFPYDDNFTRLTFELTF